MKQRKRLLSLICVALMTIEFLPTQLIANATLNSNEVKEVEESENKDIQKEDSDTKKEVVSEEKTADISKLEGETEVKEEKVEKGETAQQEGDNTVAVQPAIEEKPVVVEETSKKPRRKKSKLN